MILFAERIEREKEIPLLLEAMKRHKGELPSAHLIVAGRGSLLSEMKGRAERQGVDDRVDFTGHLPMDKLRDYYGLSDLFVLVSYYEGTAKVLKEAALAGLPIVATEVSGTDEVVIDGKSDYLIPVGTLTRCAKSWSSSLRTIKRPREWVKSAGGMWRRRSTLTETLGKLWAPGRRYTGFVKTIEPASIQVMTASLKLLNLEIG